jgi:kynurenine formamidase
MIKSSLEEALEGYEVVDLSHVLEDGMPRPQVPYGHVPWKLEERGDGFNTYMVLVFEHAGTHVDAPFHLAGVGAPTVENVPLTGWMGPLLVIDMRHKGERELVGRGEIEEWEKKHTTIMKGDIVFFNFGWARNWRVPSGVEKQPYLRNNPGLSEEAALYLAEKGVKLVGGDTPTIDSDADPEEHAHRVLLPRRILILENAASLDRVPPTGAYLMAFPLPIGGGTGSPVRAVAFVPRNPR